MKKFDLENLERKNIYATPENLFEDIQERVLSGVKEFDLEKLERKNIYRVSEDLFENIQGKVLSEIKTERKAPVFQLKWGYAAAASLALIFGATFVYQLNSDGSQDGITENYVENIPEPKTESQIAYETFASDLTSVENADQRTENQVAVKPAVSKKVINENPVKVKSKTSQTITEADMNEYLDSFTSSEIAELANNSNQDIYLDLYN